MRERWEGDTRGAGVASAQAFADGLDELADAARAEAWVAEDAEVHLLPHLERACAALPLELLAATTAPDGCFDVELRWTGEGDGVGAKRQAALALVGAVAEGATYVRQRRTGDGLVFEIVTGMLQPDAHFAPHGHTLRLRMR